MDNIFNRIRIYGENKKETYDERHGNEATLVNLGLGNDLGRHFELRTRKLHFLLHSSVKVEANFKSKRGNCVELLQKDGAIYGTVNGQQTVSVSVTMPLFQHY